jgi:hypothetical protein
MVNSSSNHLSSSLLWQQVKCAAKHIDIQLYVVKEKIQNHIESIEHISTKQVFADPLIKDLPPNAFREHTVDMGLWYNLWFWILRAQNKLRICFKIERCIVAYYSDRANYYDDACLR